MKKPNILFLFALISAFSFAQTNPSDSIPKKEPSVLIQKENMPIDSLIERKYKAMNNNNIGNANQLSSENQKKGTQFLPFLIGGFIGSTLFAVATSENGFYGAGPKIVIGTLSTAIIGLFIPKYRKNSVPE